MLLQVTSNNSIYNNIKVIGSTTQPTAAENLIWVNTSTSITTWCFAPSTPVGDLSTNGAVWISTYGLTDWTVNAINQNGIYIRPTGVFQYINDEWVAKEGRFYINGAWNDISFTYHPIISGHCMPQYTQGFNGLTPNITFAGTNTTYYKWTDGVGAYLYTGNATNRYWHLTTPIYLDSTKSTITIVAKQTANGNRTRRFGIKTSIASITKTGNFTKSVSITSNGTHTLSISGITAGNYYLAGWVKGYYDSGTATNYSCSLTISDILIT